MSEVNFWILVIIVALFALFALYLYSLDEPPLS
jgi:hypothetical protein